MLRERLINTLQYVPGQQQTVDLPRDACFHMLQFSCFGANLASTQLAVTGTGGRFAPGFPFNMIEEIRIIRNGSDVVFQGSGKQLAYEHFILNTSAPFARLFTTNANVETLLTQTVRGLTVPANPDGINQRVAGFQVPTAAGTTVNVGVDAEMELWFQNGTDDSFFSTLVDARPLATFQAQIRWAPMNAFYIPGTDETAVLTASWGISSYDQDNVKQDQPWGTFKRSSQSYANFAYGSNQQQIVLSRGNYFQSIQFETLAYKSLSTIIPMPENAVMARILNRLNTQYNLRDTSFRLLQAKNMSDYGGRAQPYAQAGGTPQGQACLYYPAAIDSRKELIATFALDVFDLLVDVNPAASAQNGPTTALTNPVINLLIEEIIPGESVAKNAPQGAVNGSTVRTSAKPYA